MTDQNTRILRDAADLCTLCHGAALAAGWYTDLQTGEPIKRNHGEVLMLATSEICEAMDAWDGRLLDDKLTHRRGVEVELADFLIRTFDTMPGMGFREPFLRALNLLQRDRPPYYGGDGGPVGPARFLGIIRHLADAMEADRKDAPSRRYPSLPGIVVHVGQAVRATVHLGILLEADLWDALHEKVAFNAQREDHKIENRRAAGGKAYR